MSIAHPEAHDPSEDRGVIPWMVKNKVTPNLLMLALVVGGLFMSTQIKQEVFPEFTLDLVTVSVAYPGASPEEVERAIVLPLEEALLDIEDVEEMVGSAGEGAGTVSLQLYNGSDVDQIRQDVQQAVDRIRIFPRDAEEPNIRVAARRREVIELIVHGEVPERTLRELAELVRDELLNSEEITTVEVGGVRAAEIHVEVPEETLRAYGLTLQEIATRIQAASVELPGGSVRTDGGEILLRVTDRRDWAREFEHVPILTTASGTVVHLGELASVSEGFEDVDRYTLYDGEPSIELEIYRVGDQTPIGISDAVHERMDEIAAMLPAGVHATIVDDRSEIYRQRLELLLKNMFLGLVLVIVMLGLSLEPKVAFWVTMGIPISFVGSLLFLPLLDVSINMISMFAYIVALGIVVDDAIVAGENIYEYRSKGMSFRRAAIEGAKDVAVPITFSILTNMAAFLPLLFVPGFMGQIWKTIPLVVCTVFAISWVESLLILPEHLSHGVQTPRHELGPLRRFQMLFNRGISGFAARVYGPVQRFFMRWRLVTLAIGVAVLFSTMGYVRGGHIPLIFMPRVESDSASVTVSLPPGSPLSEAVRIRDQLLAGIDEVAARYPQEGGGSELVIGTSASIDGPNIDIEAFLRPPGVRPLGTREVTQAWREAAGELTGTERVRFEFDRGGPGSGANLTILLSHRDVETLERAATTLAESLAALPNVSDVDDGSSDGKQQLDFALTPAGESLGLTSTEVARQVRASFLGAEALRQQRQRDEVRVLVRRPDSERTSEGDIDSLMIAAPGGVFVPLREVAEVDRGRSYTSIQRIDGRRTLQVTANVEPVGETQNVIANLERDVLPQLRAGIPGLGVDYGGQQESMAESMGALLSGFLLAMVGIYFLLAIPFRSYIQPLIVMIAIPFGIVGAVLGHIFMGFELSIMSMMGLVALSGVLVNDSLLLVDYANTRRKDGVDAWTAMAEAGVRRFRPVLLTTATTFCGLAPMIFETSRQARFMIPMAISLGFGILFATLITLIIVPCLYLFIEDVRRQGLRFRAWLATGNPRRRGQGAPVA